MKTYDVDLNKVVVKTYKFLRDNDVPKHWSKTRNERYDVHLMIVLYVLFCMADKSYRRFRRLLESCPPTRLKLDNVPSIWTLWRAWRRIPPRLFRKLVQLSGKGGRDKVAALDPTHFQITRPSVAYCKRTKRKLEREPNRKVSIVTGTRSLRILDAVIMKDSHSMLKRGMGDLLRGYTVWQQTRHFYAKCFTHNILMSCNK